ncbi:MAG: hypothetical protein V4724_16305 [Pseudomonadota bacterium]
MFARLRSLLNKPAQDSTWPFDQAPNVAALTTRQVIEDGLPVLRVVHYSNDDSWAFTCGTTSDSSDIRVVAMEEAVQIDRTLLCIASLPPGWGASRTDVGGEWEKYEAKSA